MDGGHNGEMSNNYKKVWVKIEAEKWMKERKCCLMVCSWYFAALLMWVNCSKIKQPLEKWVRPLMVVIRDHKVQNSLKGPK